MVIFPLAVPVIFLVAPIVDPKVNKPPVVVKVMFPPEVTASWVRIFPEAAPVMLPVASTVDPKVNTPPEDVKVTFPPEFTAPSRVTEVVAVPVIFPPAVKVPAALVTNAPPAAVAVNVVAAETARPIVTVVAPNKVTDPSVLVIEPVELLSPPAEVVRLIFPSAVGFPVTLTAPVTSSAVALLKKRPPKLAVEAAAIVAPESSATEVVNGAVNVPTEPALVIDRTPVPPIVISVPIKGLVTAPVPTFRVNVLLFASVIPPLKTTGLEAPRKVKL